MANTLDSVALNGHWSGDSAAHFANYSGGVFNPYVGTWGVHVIHGGGHAASNDNSVFIANYNTLEFERVCGPTVLPTDSAYEAAITASGVLSVANPCEVALGVPGSAHTYDCLAILPPSICGDPQGALIRAVSGAVGRASSRDSGWSHAFKFTPRTWERWSTNSAGAWAPGGSVAHDKTRQRIWPIHSNALGVASSLDLASRTWTNNTAGAAGLGANSYADMVYSAHAASHDLIVVTTSGQDSTPVENAIARFHYFPAGSNGTSRTAVTFTNGNLPDARYGRGTLLYVPELGKLVYWTQQQTPDTYYEINIPPNPATPWTWVAKMITGDYKPSTLDPRPAGSTYKRMDYAPQLKSLIWVTARPLLDFVFGDRVIAIRLVA